MAAINDNFAPWRYGSIDSVQRRHAQLFSDSAREVDQEADSRFQRLYDSMGHLMKAPSNRPDLGGTSSSGGGLLDSLTSGPMALGADLRDTAGDLAHLRNPLPDLAHAGVSAIQTGFGPLSLPREYIGKPAFGVASGLTSAPTEYDPETGQPFKRTADAGDVLHSIASAVQHPVRAYQQGREATEEYLADPNKNFAHQALTNVVTDPLSYVGPGLAKAGIEMTGAAAARGLGGVAARQAIHLLDTGGPGAVIGANLGSSYDVAHGEDIPGWNNLPEEYRQLLVSLGGGIVGGKLYQIGRAHAPAIAAAIHEGETGGGPLPGWRRNPDEPPPAGPQRRPDTVQVPHDTIGHRLDLFQAQNVPEGMAYDPARIERYVNNFDPNKVEPGLLVHDTSTGEDVVLGGHHRLELMKRMHAAGQYPETGQWNVIDADLSNPSDVRDVQALAISHNYQQTDMQVKSHVNSYRILAGGGRSDAEIGKMLNQKQQWVEDMSHLASLPDDILERVNQEPGLQGVAAEIGRAAKTYHFKDADTRGLFNRYGPNAETPLSRTALRATLTTIGRDLTGPGQVETGGFDGADWDATKSNVLDAIDEMGSVQQKLDAQKRALNQAAKTVASLPGAETEADVISTLAKLRKGIEDTQAQLIEARNNYAAARKARFEDQSGGVAGTDRVPPADQPPHPPAEAPAGPRDATGVHPESVMGTRVGTPEVAHGDGVDYELYPEGIVRILDTDSGQSIEVRKFTTPEMARWYWERAVAHDTPREAAPPAEAQPGLDLEGGSRGAMPPPLNQTDFFGDVPQGEAKPPSSEAQPPSAALEPVAAAQTEPPPPPGQEPPKSEPGANSQRENPPPLDTTNPHATLGLDPNKTYSPAELKSAWREQMRRYHPDVNPSETATADAKAINQAYDDLLHGKTGYSYSNAGAGTGPRGWQYAQGGASSGNPNPPGGGARTAGAAGGGAGGVPPRGATGGATGTGGAGPGWGPSATGAGWGAGPGAPTGPTYAHFAPGEDFDIFKARPVSETVARSEAWLLTAKGKFDQAVRQLLAKVGGVTFDRNLILNSKITPFLIGEKNRTRNIINGWATVQRETLEDLFKRVGLEVKQDSAGDFRINGTGPSIEDVVDSRGRAADPTAQAFYDALTPEQKAAIARLERAQEELNKTIEAHGGKIYTGGDIVGEYFPRKVNSIAGVDRTSGGSNPHSPRTWEAISDATGNGVKYNNPWDAWEAGARGKLHDAQDAYMREALAPLAVKAGDPDPLSSTGGVIRKGFGYDTTGVRAFDGPHPLAADMLFPQDVADRIRAAYDTSKGDHFLLKFPRAINSVLTPLRASGDLSATLQQGASYWLHNPGQAAKMWGATIRSLVNPDVYYQALGKLDNSGPGLDQHASWGAHFTNAVDDEMLLPNIAKRVSGGRLNEVPVLGTLARKSNEHFSRFLNLARADMGNDLWERVQAAKAKEPSLNVDEQMTKGWNSINRMTGWTGRAPTDLEAAFVFAPRYTAATIEQIAAAFTKGDIEGSMARAHLVKLLAVSAASAYAVNALTGYHTDLDPRDTNFLRMRNLQGLDVTGMGSYAVLTRAIANSLAGNDERPDLTAPFQFGEAKLAPVQSAIYDIVKGRTYLREPLDTSSPGGIFETAKQLGEQAAPFTVQDFLQSGPAAAVVGASGLSSRLQSPTERLAAARGPGYDQLRGDQKALINERSDVVAAQRAADEQALRKGGNSALLVNIRRTAAAGAAENGANLARGKDANGNFFGGNEYRDAYHNLQTYLAGQRDLLAKATTDPEVQGWFDLYGLAEDASKKLDTTRLDLLQANYRDHHPGIDGKVAEVTGIHDDQTLRDYRQAQAQARVYFSLPSFLGLDAAQSNQASDALKAAAGLVTAGQAKDRKHALAMLYASNPTGVGYAMAATKMKPNPERANFRATHPLFSRFYTDAVTV